ncbi:MAG: hypothetical protein EOP19_02395 [Hyphomicrobiales bacterium]|nr:MAG: hypothetical protein EOP19_02395 [Hyphomicrobiales bacterium]
MLASAGCLREMYLTPMAMRTSATPTMMQASISISRFSARMVTVAAIQMPASAPAISEANG